jgi:hypothetical protein
VLPGPPTAARHTSRSRSGSAPASPVIASRSAPRPNGSRCSPTTNAVAASMRARPPAKRPAGRRRRGRLHPFDPHAAKKMFMLVRAATSAPASSRQTSLQRRGVFRDEIAAAAMIDRLVHYAEILALQRRQLPPQRTATSHAHPQTTDPPPGEPGAGSAPLSAYGLGLRRPGDTPQGGQFSTGATGSSFQPALTRKPAAARVVFISTRGRAGHRAVERVAADPHLPWSAQAGRPRSRTVTSSDDQCPASRAFLLS